MLVLKTLLYHIKYHLASLLELIINYLALFFGDQRQLLALIFVPLCWLLLSTIGHLFFPNLKHTEISPLLGWGILSSFFIIIGVFTELNISKICLFLPIILVATIFLGHYNKKSILPRIHWQAIALLLPLLFLTSAMESSQWDEFSHWLPAQRFLLETGKFPSLKNPPDGTPMFSAYPYAWPILSTLPSTLSGQVLENSSPLFNLLLLIVVGSTAIKIFAELSHNKIEEQTSWGTAAFSILAVTVFNPTFIQKIILTNYADFATAVCAIMCAILGWRILNNLSYKKSTFIVCSAFQFAILMSLLVNVKQTNLAIFAIIIFSMILIALKDPTISTKKFFKTLPILIIPALGIYLIWRFHVIVGLGELAHEFNFSPLSEWNFDILHLILKKMVIVGFKKFGFFGLMILASLIAIKKYFNIKTKYDRLIIIIAMMFIGHNAFLLLTYVGSFGKQDAQNVVSFWRYNTHVGLTAVIFIMATLGNYFHKPLFRKLDKLPLSQISICLVISLPFIFAEKVRFDLEGPKPHLNRVARDLTNYISPKAPIFMLNPLGTAEGVIITRYRIRRNVEFPWSNHMSQTPNEIKNFINKIPEGGYLLVHSVNKSVSSILPMTDETGSFLLKFINKKPIIIKNWKFPPSYTPA